MTTTQILILVLVLLVVAAIAAYVMAQAKKRKHLQSRFGPEYDRTVEGLVLKDVAAATVQYHPEAGPGPHDARHLFDSFLELAHA